jgi:hypothetical protein
MLLSAASASHAQPITVPAGLNDGDQSRRATISVLGIGIAFGLWTIAGAKPVTSGKLTGLAVPPAEQIKFDELGSLGPFLPLITNGFAAFGVTFTSACWDDGTAFGVNPALVRGFDGRPPFAQAMTIIASAEIRLQADRPPSRMW